MTIITEPLSLEKDDNRIIKNDKIKQSLKNTRDRRKNQEAKTYECKIVKNKLTIQQLETLDKMFLEAKWYYNSIINHLENENINSFNNKVKTVKVRMGSESDDYEDRQLKVLPASMKQKLITRVKDNLSSLKAKKDKGYKVGKLEYTKNITSVPLKQYGIDYVVLPNNKVRISKVGKVNVRGLDQFSQDAEWSTANIIKKANDYYIHITVYINKVIDNSWIGLPIIGLDFGIKDHITTSNGLKINSIVTLSKRIKNLQRKLSRQVKGSKNYIKTIIKIRKAYDRLSNLKDDAANKIVNYLLTHYSNIIMQDENIKGWHSGLFGKQVQYSILGRVKARLVSNPRVVVLNRSVPTTQYCPDCGALNKHFLDKRVYSCSCGYSMDRDIHAAMNMINLYVKNSSNGNIVKKSPVECGSTLEELLTSGTV